MIGPKRYVEIFNNLSLWIDRSGYRGFDPYDVKCIPWVIALTAFSSRHRIAVPIREFVFEVFYTFPRTIRFLLRIKKRYNAKAMGLIAHSQLQFHQYSGNNHNLQTSLACLIWLEKNMVKTGSGGGWGYPFDWQSNELIPKHTPNGIVTTAVGDAFWAWYLFTRESKYLETCRNICVFLASLPKDYLSDTQLCFAYTPLFQNHVHNLNLFIAEFLIKVGLEIDNQEYVQLGNCAVNYTLSDQREDGSFDYNGPPEKPNNFVDNYHTGFVLRMLHSIWKLTERSDVFTSLEKCYQHYIENFFEDGKIPKLLPHRKYRIDIHSCAESVNCLSELSETFPQGLPLAERILNWTIDNLQDREGYFYYGILKSRFTGLPYKSKIVYLRWGQAWMLKALSSFIVAKSKASQRC